GTAAVAIGMSCLAVAPSYGFLFFLLAMAGLGTACFHPQSAAMVNALSGGRRGMTMSFYITAGNAGYALGPVIVVAVVERFGMQWMPALAIPGLLSAVLLAKYAPVNWLQRTAGAGDHPSLRQVFARQWSVLSRLMGVATFRAVANISVVTFLPLLLRSRGYPDQVWATLLTVFLLSGTLGGLLGGYLSDFIGRRLVIAFSLFVSVPLLFGMLRAEGITLWIVTILAGAAVLGSFSVLTIQAQEMLPHNVGMASGLILGFSVGIGGIAMGPISLLANNIGIPQTLDLLVFSPLVAALLALTLVDRPKAAGGVAGAEAIPG
ncbi:MAG: MFS transporter, partial [Dehalococcoidia bacterium]|nr:MFS transporter [Dehalococcoidia bacterium]